MVSPQLINYVNTRFSQGLKAEDILNELKKQHDFNEEDFREALQIIQMQKTQIATVSTIDNRNINSQMFMYILFGSAIILVMFGMSKFNATRSKFYNLLSLIMIISSLLIFIGEAKLKAIWGKMEQAKKDSQRKI